MSEKLLLKINIENKKVLKLSFDKHTSTFNTLLNTIKDTISFSSKPEIIIDYPPRTISYQLNDFLKDLLVTNSIITIKEDLLTLKPMRKVISADNSCLFNSIKVLIGLNEITSDELRHIIVNIIQSDLIKYNSTFLGKTSSEYCDWIQQSTSWGGEIECIFYSHSLFLSYSSFHSFSFVVSILSEYFSIEIAVVEIETTNVYIYGENRNYTQRIYLLYDGMIGQEDINLSTFFLFLFFLTLLLLLLLS